MADKLKIIVLIYSFFLGFSNQGEAQEASSSSRSLHEPGTAVIRQTARRHRTSRRRSQIVTFVTRPGFNMLSDGRSRFFVEVTGPLSTIEQPSHRHFEILVHAANVRLSNDVLALDTRFFETPVTRMTLERRGRRDIAIIFDLRADATPHVTTEAGVENASLIVIEFPAGTYMSEEERTSLHQTEIERRSSLSNSDSSLAAVGTSGAGTTSSRPNTVQPSSSSGGNSSPSNGQSTTPPPSNAPSQNY